MYGRATFNDVHSTYLAYHKAVHALLLKMEHPPTYHSYPPTYLSTYLCLCAVAFLTVMYGRATFNDVNNTYLAYHKAVHALLLTMKRKEINEIARTEAMDQENTVMRAQGNMAARSQEKDVR